MNKPFSTIKTNVGNRVQDTSSGFKTLIGSWINQRYNEILNRFDVVKPIRSDYTFDTTAGTSDYVLPDDFGKAIHCTDTTSKTLIPEITIQQWIEGYYTDLSTSGQVSKYVIYDDTVITQPASASVVSIVSSSASDTTQTVYIRGLSGNREDSEEITVTGTTAASGSKSFSRILMIGKSATTVGVITVSTNSGAEINGYLSTNALEHRVKKIKLVPPPVGVSTIQLPYVQETLPLSSDYDYPLVDCGDALEYGATADALRYKRQFAKAADFDRLFEESTQDLVWKYENKPNLIHRLNPQPYSRNTV